jgi:hypothetical protein
MEREVDADEYMGVVGKRDKSCDLWLWCIKQRHTRYYHNLRRLTPILYSF